MLAARRGSSVVITGPPNAGKSSMFNALCRADASIVSSTPGTTRDVVTADATLAGLSVCFADTADSGNWTSYSPVYSGDGRGKSIGTGVNAIR